MPRSTLHRVPPLLLGLLSTGGCGGKCERAWYADLDGDGFGDRAAMVRACDAPDAHVADPTDCDDEVPEVNPDAIDGCNGRDDDCDGIVDPEVKTWFADADRDGFGTTLLTTEACSPPDGFVATAGDCDDDDASIRPEGGFEVCDGRDQDCDGLVDEGAVGSDLSYPDADFDGQGDRTAGSPWCVRPAGWILLGTDCDDTNAGVFFGATEVCNGLDDDCDELVDELDPGLADPSPYWLDADADGFGTGEPAWLCEAPVGRAPQDGDCDDLDATAHPGGDEVCGGGDDDCDTLVDDADPSVDPASQVDGWSDVDGDGLGDPAALVTVCALSAGTVSNDLDCDDADPYLGQDLWLADGDGDGVGAGVPVAGSACAPPAAGYANVAAGGDCADADPAVRPRVPDPCGDGVDQDCTGVDPACRASLAGLTGLDEAHRGEVTGAGLVDGLGGWIGASGDLDGDGFADTAFAAPGAASVHVLLGPPPEVAGPWAAASVLVGTELSVAAVTPAGTEHLPWLVVGAPDDGGGVVYVVDDRTAGLDGARARIADNTVGERFGAALGPVGDQDADGTAELFVGVPGDAGGNGAVGRFDGDDLAGELVPSDAELTFTGSVGAGLGGVLSAAGDTTGDGFPEVAVAAPGISTVYVLPVTGTGTFAATAVDVATVTATAGSGLGAAVDLSADFDGDGLADLVAAAPSDDAPGADAGRVYVVPDPTGTVVAGVEAVFVVDGDAPGAAVAQSVAAADVDGDGAVDLLVGVSGAALTGADGGAVYVFLGPLTGTVAAAEAWAVLYGDVGDRAGSALSVADLDRDGWDDVWVGGPGAPGIGRAWWIPGAL